VGAVGGDWAEEERRWLQELEQRHLAEEAAARRRPDPPTQSPPLRAASGGAPPPPPPVRNLIRCRRGARRRGDRVGVCVQRRRHSVMQMAGCRGLVMHAGRDTGAS
jgi:hypothetical protein